MAHIFMTGGTGFIGTHTLAQLSQGNHTVSVLVRSSSRWEQICKGLGWSDSADTILSRIRPVIGDLGKPGLGLSHSDREKVLTAEVIIHAGGPMDIRISEAEARVVFLQAAEEMLRLAADIQLRGGLQHFIHVVGFKSPWTDENIHNPAPIIAQLEQGPPYELMKCLGDLRIREGAQELGFPLSIVHPSVVIGSSLHGETTQTGGLGILVRATARGLMSIVPGGSTHWLPLVHVDHVASFVNLLTKEATPPPTQTYYLLDDPKEGLSMQELVALIAKELRVSKPHGSISPTWLSKFLGTRLGQKLGIPKESLEFIVKKKTSFPIAPKDSLLNKHKLANKVQEEMLPSTMADLDFQLVHGHMPAEGFVRGKRGPLASLERSRSGTGQLTKNEGLIRSNAELRLEGHPLAQHKNTLLFVHGTLSGADCLLPLAAQFPEHDVCLVDLPGFGRSPYHHAADVMEGHIAALVEAIRAFDSPVTLVGHSLGGLLAAHAYARVPERIHRLHLLQPALQPAARMYRSARLNQLALRRLREKNLRKQLLAQRCFVDISDIPASYVTYVLQELQSPRVRKTTAETLSALTRAEAFPPQQQAKLLREASILWGTQDRAMPWAEELRSAHTLEIEAAHHFPISHPELTAQLLRQQGL
ncbi:alpha/beta fold hydrolase [Paenibacillus qinlingensis]|uniref:alpha/beta fold hydrolase n=1 Tax=Paenibacillus qinlingensis TaxID=1837343 RepID=UPI0015630F89|nr:alpha/beta fold hydrolase [Paenibacillus qinlingensis]NQX63880.1 alpha/beta fold hydrolase [Paenibacillus qinlingensis]